MKNLFALLICVFSLFFQRSAFAQPYKLYDQNGNAISAGNDWNRALPGGRLLFMLKSEDIAITDGTSNGTDTLFLPSGTPMREIPYDSLLGPQKDKLVFFKQVGSQHRLHTFDINTFAIKEAFALPDSMTFPKLLGVMKNELYFEVSVTSTTGFYALLCRMNIGLNQLTIIERTKEDNFGIGLIGDFLNDANYCYYQKGTDTVFVSNGQPFQQRALIGSLPYNIRFINTSIGVLSISRDQGHISVSRLEQSTEKVNHLDSIAVSGSSGSTLVDHFIDGNVMYFVLGTSMYYFDLTMRKITLMATPALGTNTTTSLFCRCDGNYYVYGSVHATKRWVGVYQFQPATKTFTRKYNHIDSIQHINSFDDALVCHQTNVAMNWSRDSITDGVLLFNPASLDTSYFAGRKDAVPFASSGSMFFWAGNNQSVYELYAVNTSLVSTLEPTHEPSSILALPNPVCSDLRLSYPETLAGHSASVQLFNQLGVLCLSANITHPQEVISADDLPSGLYLAKVQVKNQVFQAKIYKE